MPNEMYEKGLQIRREVLGSEYVDRAIGSADDFNKEFQEILTEYCWGAVWGRPGLSRKQRSLNNICMLSALGRSHELELHLKGALTNGVTVDEIKETLIQVAVYCGAPAAVEGFRIARRVVDEHRKAEAADANLRFHRPRQHGRPHGAQSRRRRSRGGVLRCRRHSGAGAARGAHCRVGRGSSAAGPHRLPLLPDGPVVLQVAREIADCPDRAVEIVVDSTTAGMPDARAAHDVLAEAGIRYADAPVSGGTKGSKAGTLAMMVAAPDDLYAEIEPYIRPMAANARHVGTQPGQGMAMKLLNNFLSATAMAATSEAVAFGVSQGLDMMTILETVNVSTGRNTATEDKFPNRIATGAFDAGFATKLMAKDLRLYEASVTAAGAPRRLAGQLRDIWNGLEAARPDSDFTEIYKHVRDGPKL